VKNKKVVYYVVLAVLVGIFLFAAIKLGSYYMEKMRSDQILDDATQFTDPVNPGTPDNDNEGEGEEQTGDPEMINVDFEAMKELNKDVVAWIYCPNTMLNYPIVQADDNDYYLYRLLDGTSNSNGSIFMDYRNGADFSDENTLIYGHHMQTGAMFGELINYKKQSFYEAHPYIYIITPTQTYRMDLFAACIVDSVSDVYSLTLSDDLIEEMISDSTFDADIPFPEGNIVTLSTCTYEYDDARYVVMGQLVPVEIEADAE